MSAASSSPFPPGSLDWLTGHRQEPGSRVLALAPSPGLCRALAGMGMTVVAVHRDHDVAVRCHRIPGVTGVCALAESLPLEACSFDAVVCHQAFHTLAPGLVLPQIARVLGPDGCLGVSWMVRDDTVPWVRRLAELLRTVDSTAMRGDYGSQAAEALLTSPHFPEVDHADHRIWVPVTRPQLVSMALDRPAVAALDEASRQGLVARVERLHDDACGPGGLRLPYQLRTWRGWVDHSELTSPLEVDRGGLVIQI